MINNLKNLWELSKLKPVLEGGEVKLQQEVEEDRKPIGQAIILEDKLDIFNEDTEQLHTDSTNNI